MRDLNTITTSEMNQEEWDKFRKQWISEYARSLIVNSDVEEPIAQEIAEIRFESYCGQEGYTMRDTLIMEAREES